MPYSIEWEIKGPVIRFTGTVTRDEAVQAHTAGTHDPRSRTAEFLIVDFTDVAQIGFSVSEVRRITETDVVASEAVKKLKVCVVTRDDVMRGYAKLYEVAASRIGWKVGIFETANAARLWATNS